MNFVANRIAIYSYGIYLGHSFFIWWALTERNNWPLLWAMLLIIPVALYEGFERPAIDAGRRIAKRMSRPRRPA